MVMVFMVDRLLHLWLLHLWLVFIAFMVVIAFLIGTASLLRNVCSVYFLVGTDLSIEDPLIGHLNLREYSLSRLNGFPIHDNVFIKNGAKYYCCGYNKLYKVGWENREFLTVKNKELNYRG